METYENEFLKAPEHDTLEYTSSNGKNKNKHDDDIGDENKNNDNNLNSDFWTHINKVFREEDQRHPHEDEDANNDVSIENKHIVGFHDEWIALLPKSSQRLIPKGCSLNGISLENEESGIRFFDLF